MNYLTEKRLGNLLKELYPNNIFIHDRIVPNSNSRRRPDYRCDELKLIVEFDGYKHYTSAEKIISEAEKTQLYTEMGYKVVRIPYFVQPTSYAISILFSKKIKNDSEYPHGFVDNKCILPCDFCEMGIDKFKKDYNRFNEIQEDILKSINDKIEEKGDIRKVLPSSLYNLI